MTRRSWLCDLGKLMPFTLVVLAIVALTGAEIATAQDEDASGGSAAKDRRVGHTVKRIEVPAADVPSSAQKKPRQVDVHLWYPADPRALSSAKPTFYSSALYGKALPDGWDPLKWDIEAEVARETETDAVDQSGPAFPVIVFSHGALGDPINYAHTLELIAGAGFVVAAPSHVTDTRDDQRIDFVNKEADGWFECNAPRPEGVEACSRPNPPQGAPQNDPTVRFRMIERARDITAVLDGLDPTKTDTPWLDGRADVNRAGVMGHSRGTVSALAAAGGSDRDPRLENRAPLQVWGFRHDERVKAVMGMGGIGGSPAVSFSPDLEQITVPTLLVAGKLDNTSAHSISEAAFKQVGCPRPSLSQDWRVPRACEDPEAEKAFVSIDNAHHRSFHSTNCDQMQAAGAIAQANAQAILDKETLVDILTRGGGLAKDYCSYASFTNPVDITKLVSSIAGFTPTRDNVPVTGLATDEVKEGMKELAVAFFGTVLKRTGNDGTHFTRYLAPKWLEKHELAKDSPMEGSAVVCAGEDAILPPGQTGASSDALCPQATSE